MGDHPADRTGRLSPLTVSGRGDTDTIAAIATPPGRGAIGVIRVSGPDASSILETITGSLPAPRHARYCDFHGRSTTATVHPIDRGIVLYFPAPNSFTGEDVVEFQGHGGTVVLHLLLREILALGARLARPGEFSERAFLNGKIDLVQAEAIADLIDSSTEQAARNAMRSLQGAFSARVHELLERMITLRVYVEASIDFPDEDIDFLGDAQVAEQLRGLRSSLESIGHAARNGALVRDGMRVVLAGKPNAGKSSLLNALAGRDSAIVTPIAGTTRDVLREQIQIDGMPLHIIDTAGLHHNPDDIEREGIRRALTEVRRADRVLLVIDSSGPDTPANVLDAELRDVRQDLPPITVILNKCDLSGRKPGPVTDQPHPTIALSALNGAGMDALRLYLVDAVGYHALPEGDFSARSRHLDAIARTARAIDCAETVLLSNNAPELVAERLREAHTALAEITGEFGHEDLLDRIFGSFCIGK